MLGLLARDQKVYRRRLPWLLSQNVKALTKAKVLDYTISIKISVILIRLRIGLGCRVGDGNGDIELREVARKRDNVGLAEHKQARERLTLWQVGRFTVAFEVLACIPLRFGRMAFVACSSSR